MNQAVALHPWERQHHLNSEDNVLMIDGVNVNHLIKRYGSPLFVYSENKLRGNALDILSSFRQVHEKTRVCFASKACANLSVLKVFKEAGLSIEVNSGGAFFKASAAGD
jgi:diaminopimelate decarboxylase